MKASRKASTSPLVVAELTSDRALAAAFPLMSQLRARIEADTFVGEVRRQQLEGYRLLGGTVDGKLVALAGVRRSHTLARGEHLFVDDLVTLESRRGKGHGRALLTWIAAHAAEQGLGLLCLDSRDTARGFYETLGFEFLTALPCRIQVSALVGRKPRR